MEFDFTSNIPSQKMESKGEAKLTRLLNSYGYLPVWSSVNPVNLNISIRVKKLTFRALALRQSDRANEGLTLETSAFLPFTVANLRFQPSC